MTEHNQFIYFCRAVANLSKNAKYAISDMQIVSWDSPEIPKPTKEEIQLEIENLIRLDEETKYKNDRYKEYPSIQEQLDMQYWDSVNGTTTWQDAINAVKAKYPKGA